MIGARFVRDPEIGEQEGRGQFGGRLFHREGMPGPPGAERPVEPMGSAAGVSTFVNMGGIEALGIVEGAEVRHVDAVFGDMIISAGRPVDGIDAERGDKPLGGRNAVALGQDQTGLRGVAVDLIGVEQAERPGEEPHAIAAVIVAILLIAAADLLPEDAKAGLLALANLGTEHLPLAIGAPDPARIAAGIGGGPERYGVDAPIGFAAGDVGRASDIGAAMMPRHAPGTGASFDRGDDRVGDASVDV